MDACHVVGLLGELGGKTAVLDIGDFKPDMFPFIVFRTVFLVHLESDFGQQVVPGILKGLEQIFQAFGSQGAHPVGLRGRDHVDGVSFQHVIVDGKGGVAPFLYTLLGGIDEDTAGILIVSFFPVFTSAQHIRRIALHCLFPVNQGDYQRGILVEVSEKERLFGLRRFLQLQKAVCQGLQDGVMVLAGFLCGT